MEDHMRVAFALFIALHGLAHLPGFMASWQIVHLEALPYKTTVFAGHVDLGHAGSAWIRAK
jgi:hypothetical protein